jgi:hypothetical protein
MDADDGWGWALLAVLGANVNGGGKKRGWGWLANTRPLFQTQLCWLTGSWSSRHIASVGEYNLAGQ